MKIEKIITDERFVQKGFGLKEEIKGALNSAYYSKLVNYIQNNDHRLDLDAITFLMAVDFGFCYGVVRAIDYAYQTREKFPDRRIFITGEIIHNPHVNQRLFEMGIKFLAGQYQGDTNFDMIRPEDVVLLTAFGATIQEMKILNDRGCIVVDTTCGSVLNVWKNVEKYARDGYTAVVHGKYYHEETKATTSRTTIHPNGKYIVILNKDETFIVRDYILNGGDKGKFMNRFNDACSEKFDPDKDLNRIGLANQTTMLSSESLEVSEILKNVMIKKFGNADLDYHFQNFDTICSATQERQDAILKLLKEHELDLMIVIGGFNSSNTAHLAEISSQYTSTYHIEAVRCIISDDEIQHKPIGGMEPVISKDWLPEGTINIGITAGASTPNNKIGEVIQKIAKFRNQNIFDIIQN